MQNNYVTADGIINVQNIGTATGTLVAPKFSSLYLFREFYVVLQDDAIIFQGRFIDEGLLHVRTMEDAERNK